MLTTLHTSYTDTRASDLAWVLGREPLPALATLDLELADVTLQLRLLGASHQVLLDGEGGHCSETVACVPGSSTPLPIGVADHVGGWEYHFAARVERLSPVSFAGRAQELLALVADHPHGLAGVFPGSPDAFTAMLAQRQDGETLWRTWHAYPQEGQLVVTRTRLAAPAHAERAPIPSASAGRKSAQVSRAAALL
ncbi:DUF2617 family protein [Streptomyces tsukubensis]|uniref:DUF2617 domain-containing protein n=1 Tax=Streptomyces tsukubensis TaxID=83656 RepID=A0A1V4A4L7_9ACTN|nr:DUF2617 family protein [Streptomyces tsukubensis]OON74900.1 hypothetical protein B1H18_24045 [Streptomyces tsukubensis]QFR94787.1 DUF2617 family protein [Streptomyces tsukubensis]